MKEYTIIGDFYFEEKKYQLLLDDNKKMFFLKLDDNNKQSYITLGELIKLTEKFSYNPYILYTDYNNGVDNNNNMYNTTYQAPKKKKMKLIPKILIGTSIATVSLPLIAIIASQVAAFNYRSHRYYQQPVSYSQSTTQPTTSASEVEEKYKETISYDKNPENDKTQQKIDEIYKKIEKEKKNFKVEDKLEGFNLQLIYDSSKLDEVFGYPKEDITYDKIRETINNNNNISGNFKDMYLSLANNLEKQYPSMDLRIWYENLKTIKILEVDEMDMKLKALSATAFACYRKDENTIYTVKGYEYTPHTWNYQVMIHEMCHPIRSSVIKRENDEIRIQFESSSGSGTIISEAMNSLLALRSYDKNEKDIAYQLQSNMIEIIVDSMDNYTYQDYVEHNITYFENELNKQNNNDDAIEILALMDLQYKDYHDNDISVEQSQFYKLYDYIAKMYYDKNITPDTSYQEAKEIKNNLVEKITYDVPEEYNIDTKHFDKYLKTYCNEKGITSEKTK